MASIIQIIAVNELRSGEKDGRKWQMQDAECVLLNDAGEMTQVGVLMVPKDLLGKVTPGIYRPYYEMRPNQMKDGQRRIEAQLTSLVAVRREGPGFVLADAPKASAKG